MNKWYLIAAATFVLGYALGVPWSEPESVAPSVLSFPDEEEALDADNAVANNSGTIADLAVKTPKEEKKPSIEKETSSTWVKTAIWEELQGEWGGKLGGPLPKVTIAKPNPKRKWKSQPADYNVKFILSITGGLYTGGCDIYVSGKAFCRVHDPADKKTYDAGVERDGLIVAEIKRNGKELRLTVPNGVVTELVKRPK